MAPGHGLCVAAAGERGGVLGSSNGSSRLKRRLPSCAGLLEYIKCPGLLALRGRIGCVRLGVEEPRRRPYCSRWAESSISF